MRKSPCLIPTDNINLFVWCLHAGKGELIASHISLLIHNSRFLGFRTQTLGQVQDGVYTPESHPTDLPSFYQSKKSNWVDVIVTRTTLYILIPSHYPFDFWVSQPTIACEDGPFFFMRNCPGTCKMVSSLPDLCLLNAKSLRSPATTGITKYLQILLSNYPCAAATIVSWRWSDLAGDGKEIFVIRKTNLYKTKICTMKSVF